MKGPALNLCLAVLIVIALASACLLGSTPLALKQVLLAFTGQGDAGTVLVVWQIRLPRALAALAVGFALGISGGALQGLLRNPLAEPGVLGISAMAALMATVTLFYGLASAATYALPLSAMAGAIAATAIIAYAASRTGSVVSLILVGVGLSSFAGAVMSLLMNFAPHPFTLTDMINWMLGSVANRSLTDLLLVAPLMALGVTLLLSSKRGLSALTLGEEAATGIGVNVPRQRLLVVLGAGMATGAAVALAGTIGFVGIVAPHLVRPLLHHDPGASLLPSGLLAGLILVLADIIIRVMPTTAELKLGVVAALVGAPVFIWIAMQRRY